MRGIIAVCLLLFHESHGKTWLRADGNSTNTYSLIRSVLGEQSVEVPDCAHPSDGQHITQILDPILNLPVFAFHIHTDVDNDRCEIFDRQRIEIKSYDDSARKLKGFYGETVTFSWNFRLDSQLHASSTFTHIHQIKLHGNPVITITPRKFSDKQILEIIHVDRDNVFRRLETDDLSKYLGAWIHVKEELTYSENGTYLLELSKNGEQLMTVNKQGIDMWRPEFTFLRPKFGLYRSLGNKTNLRDEIGYFYDFCFSKGTKQSQKCT